MKVVICGDCGDFVRLRPDLWSRCSCGRAGGVYRGDRDALYSGPQGTAIIGMHAGSLTTAVGRDQQDRRDHVERDLGHEFKAFTVPWSAPTITRVPNARVFEEHQEKTAAEKAREVGGKMITFKTHDEPPSKVYVVVRSRTVGSVGDLPDSVADEITNPSQLKNFKAFTGELEQEYPGLAEQRILREETETFLARLRERLKSARGETSQTEVARRMGIKGQSRISCLENGDTDLSVEALYRYCRAIGYVPVISLVPDNSGNGDETDADD